MLPCTDITKVIPVHMVLIWVMTVHTVRWTPMFTMEMTAVCSTKTNQSTQHHNREDTGSGVLGCVVRWMLLDVSQEHNSGVLRCVVK